MNWTPWHDLSLNDRRDLHAFKLQLDQQYRDLEGREKALIRFTDACKSRGLEANAEELWKTHYDAMASGLFNENKEKSKGRHLPHAQENKPKPGNPPPPSEGKYKGFYDVNRENPYDPNSPLKKGVTKPLSTNLQSPKITQPLKPPPPSGLEPWEIRGEQDKIGQRLPRVERIPDDAYKLRPNRRQDFFNVARNRLQQITHPVDTLRQHAVSQVKNAAVKTFNRLGGQAVKAGIKKAATSAVVKLGISAAAGAASGGISLAIQAGIGAINKITGGFVDNAIRTGLSFTPIGILTAKTEEEREERTAQIAALIFGIIMIPILILFFFLFFIFFNGTLQDALKNSQNQLTGLTITLIGPASINNGQKISYEIDVSCDTTCQGLGSIIIYMPAPATTTFDSADGVNSGTEPVTWRLNDNTPSSATGGTNNYVFHATFKTTAATNNTNVVGYAYGDLEGNNLPPVPGLTTFTKTAQDHITNGGQIDYKIIAHYTSSDDVTITDALPANTTLVGKPSGTLASNSTNSVLVWKLRDNGKGPDYTFTFSVKAGAGANDTVVTNKAIATIPNSSSTGINASARIKRIRSGDPSQYYLPRQAGWARSDCSGCSQAEVMNAYGKSVICGDILQYEFDHGYWSLAQGLLNWFSIKDTAHHFGFNAIVGQGDKTLDQIINTANGGEPVVMGIGDHILVIKGGDATNVFLVDSSPFNYTTVTRQQFQFGMPGNPQEGWVSAGHKSYAILTPQ